MKTAVFGYLGFRNFGDSLLLDAVLRECEDDSRVSIILNGELEEVISAKNQQRLHISFVRARSAGHIRAMLSAQKVVCIGGTCFHGKHSGFLVNQKIAALFAKKITWRNVGFESNYRPGALKTWLFKKTLAKITVRDAPSASIAAAALGIEAEVEPDAGFEIAASGLLDECAFSSPVDMIISPRNSMNWTDASLDRLHELMLERNIPKTRVAVLPASPLDLPLATQIAERLGAQVLSLNWIEQICAIRAARTVLAERLHHQIVGFALQKEVFVLHYMEKNTTAIAAGGFNGKAFP